MMILWSQLHFGAELVLVCDQCGAMVFADLPSHKEDHERWHASIEKLIRFVEQVAE